MFDRSISVLALGIGAWVLMPSLASAGGTPDPGTATGVLSTAEDQLLSITGEADVTANGDYVSSTAGLNQPYELYIEVPPGQARLQVDVFDADIGGGGANEYFDTQVGGSWNTRAVFALFQPDGTLFSAGAVTTCAGCDNVWLSPGIFNVAAPQPGHWLLQVDQAIYTGGNGDDENAFGIRAHDGDATAGGTEYPVYALSYVGLGERAAAATAVNREYDLYPYVTRGCSMSVRDFDADSAADWRLDTRAGVNLSTGPASLSGNDAWNTNTYSGWTSDLDATDYGLYHFFFEGVALGGGSNNVYTVYLGNDAAAGTPPTAQSEANTLRLYLPADGSTWSGNGTVNSGAGTINTPVQPYVGHSWTPTVNAPVRIGATTRIRVTVTVTNPTAQPIQFDAATTGTRVVVATVPTNGGPTALVGGSAAGPGAVAEAGAGPWTVTWAPGVVAAGATATLTYDIDVTPVAAGTLQFTGDPAGLLGAGTVATYLDGTCANGGGGATVCTNATQLASGTFTFGPLCELEADVQMPTPALISALWTEGSALGRQVGWRTVAEVGVASFRLHRVDDDGVWTPVGAAVPAALEAIHGASYRVVDSTAESGHGDTRYGVEVEDADGTVRRHGPFDAADEAPKAVVRGAAPSPPPTPRWQSATRVELPVRSTGWQRVDATALAAALDLTPDRLSDLVARAGLRLQHRGRDVAWLAVERAGQPGLEFYGLGADGDPFLAESVYVLTMAPGSVIDPIVSPPAGSSVFVDGFEAADLCAWSALVGGTAPASCASLDRHRRDVEEDRHAVVLAPVDPEGDFWFQHLLFAGHPTRGRADERLDVPSAAGSGAASLTVRLQGGSTATHRVRVLADEETVGVVEIEGLARHELALPIAAAKLADGALDVGVVVEAGGWVFVDGYSVDHLRRSIATDGSLAFDADHDGPMVLEGLATDSNDGAKVVDITDPRQPIEVAARPSTSPAGERWTFHAVAGRRYLAFDSRGLATVTPRPDPTADLRSPPSAVDTLIVAESALVEAAGELAAWHATEDRVPWVVDVDDIHDTFAGGERDPRAIRDFFAHVVETWPRPPRFVVLVGTGTYDYRDLHGFDAARAEGSVSPLLVASRIDIASIFPADGAFVDVGAEGGDGAPEMALGRIPVRTPDELVDYVERLRRHHRAAPSADRRLLLLADRPDGTLDFPTDADWLGSDLAQATTALVDEALVLGEESATLEGDRDRLFDHLADDNGLVAFLGHGGVDRLTSAGWLTSGDLDRLEAEAPAVYLALTCYVGLHGLPGYDALAEELVRSDGGALAFWGPAWLSSHGDAVEIGRDVVRRLGESPTPTLGEAIQRALQAAARRGVAADQLLTFQLLGDPAVVPRVGSIAEPVGDSDS